MKGLIRWLAAPALSVALVPIAAAGTITVTPTDNANTLINALLGSGSGITIVGTPTYTAPSGASGTFTGGSGAGIGVNSGVILTSGSATGAAGPNNSDSFSVENGAPGDSDLSAAAGVDTHDAAVLQFQFTSATGDLFFNYVFGSEEYNEYVGEFNDAFGFYLNGNNIALIPGTNQPVTINNVNCGNPYNPPSGGSHCNLFNNNDLDDGGPFYDIQYDGFTDVFTAHASSLGSGVNTIKLAIADAGDDALDSGVFLQGFSSVEPPPPTGVPEPPELAFMMIGLVAAALLGRRRRGR